MSNLQWNIRINEYDYCVMINALVELRNELIRTDKDTAPVDEVFVKLYDNAPRNIKKERQNEAR